MLGVLAAGDGVPLGEVMPDGESALLRWLWTLANVRSTYRIAALAAVNECRALLRTRTMSTAEQRRAVMTELADRGALWGSVLSVDEFAAVRSVGFEPVGQVFGAAVYPLFATAAVSCPGTAAHSVIPGASPMVGGWGGPAARIAQALYDGYRTAIDRMAGECSDLGGHGIVGAALQVIETPGDNTTAPTVEFKVIGTAVRGCGCPPLARPFTCELSGSDFAKLLMDGWVPAGIVLGISAAGLHDTLVTTSSGPWGTGNAEVPTYTNLIVCVRQDARNRLEETVRGLGAEGVVVSAMTLRVRSDPCHAHMVGADHFAEAVITGTAVARFADHRKAARPPSLAVRQLDAGGALNSPSWPRTPQR